MALNADKLDAVDRQILSLLQDNARLSFAEIGRRVGLSSPAVTERVRRLEEASIIRGYAARLNAQSLGLPITAFIRITVPPNRYPKFLAQLERMPAVQTCHHVSGVESHIVQVAVESVGALEVVVADLSKFGQTATSIVMSSPLERGISLKLGDESAE